jgi:hypothetical protein
MNVAKQRFLMAAIQIKAPLLSSWMSDQFLTSDCVKIMAMRQREEVDSTSLIIRPENQPCQKQAFAT